MVNSPRTPPTATGLCGWPGPAGRAFDRPSPVTWDVFGGSPPARTVVRRTRLQAPSDSGDGHCENGRVPCAPEAPDAAVADLPALLGAPEGVVIGASQQELLSTSHVLGGHRGVGGGGVAVDADLDVVH